MQIFSQCWCSEADDKTGRSRLFCPSVKHENVSSVFVCRVMEGEVTTLWCRSSSNKKSLDKHSPTCLYSVYWFPSLYFDVFWTYIFKFILFSVEFYIFCLIDCRRMDDGLYRDTIYAFSAVKWKKHDMQPDISRHFKDKTLALTQAKHIPWTTIVPFVCSCIWRCL